MNLRIYLILAGNHVERKELLDHTLGLQREKGDYCAAHTSSGLSDASLVLGPRSKGRGKRWKFLLPLLGA